MKALQSITIFLIIITLTACTTTTSKDTTAKVGLLLSDKIDDQGWNSKGYQGLLNIHSKLNVDILYKEEINTKEASLAAIEDFVNKDVNLIFGHGQMYALTFMEIKSKYPDIHFVTFNENVSGDNITSLHFEGYAMGFFAGMLASEMSETKRLGVIAAFPSQPEVEGFFEGAKFQNETTEVNVDFVASWVDKKEALEIYKAMVKDNVDVFYPAGDGYHVPLIQEIKKDGLYAIGFVSDQSDLGQSTVLTSTIQHVDQLYEIVAEDFYNDKLDSGNKYFDFADGIISLGEFSSEVPDHLQTKINNAIDVYVETGNLPNEY